MRFKSNLLLASAIAALACGQANAQTQDGSQPSDEEAAGVQEIVVTANKREENLQKVAATVSVVSQDALTRDGITTFSDLSKAVPEVRVNPGSITQLTVRGIRTGTNAPTNDAPNAFHVDGAYISRFTGLNGYFYDIERMEVLAGPQGTLYGRNSAGGTINVITAKPRLGEFLARGSIEYGNYNTLTVNAAANAPLGESVALRAAFFHTSHDGYANNGSDDEDINSARAELLFEPDPSNRLLLTADIIRQGGRGGTTTSIYEVLKSPTILNTGGVISIVPAGTAGGEIVPIVPATDVRDGRGLSGDNDAASQDVRNFGFMGQYDHDFGWATLTAQASYRESHLDNPSGSNTGYAQDPRLFTTGVIRTAGPGFFTQNSKWHSQEIRLASPSDQQLTYTLGVYHFYEKSYDNNAGSYQVSYPNSGYGTPASTIGSRIIQNPLEVNSNIANILGTTNAYAIFGQFVFSPDAVPGLHLTGGLRYNWERKHGIGNTRQNRVDCAGGCFDETATFKKMTYKANVAYDITPNNTIYFDHSTGFKSGGFSYGINPLYHPENIYSYEFGSKNRFFDDTLQLNFSAWHYDYKNVVTTTGVPFINPQLPPPGIAVSVTSVNGELEKVDGQSLALIFEPTRNDVFTFNGTHLNARFIDFDISQVLLGPFGPGGTTGYLTPGATAATYNFDGTPVGGATPEWAFSASYAHTFVLPEGELDAQLSAQYAANRMFGMFNQISRADFNTFAAAQLPDYVTLDFSLRYKPDNHPFSITGYVRNLTDEDVVVQSLYNSNRALFPVTDPSVTYAYITRTYARPRTYGIIVSFDF